MSEEKVWVTVTGYRNGKEEKTVFPHWQRVYIRKSLDEICHYAEFEAGEVDAPNIHAHDKVMIEYGTGDFKRLVTTVYVDTKKRVLNNQKFSYLFTCRSAARDIIDSSWTDDIGRTGNILFSHAVYKIASVFSIPIAVFGVDSLGRSVNVNPESATNNPTTMISVFSWKNESPWAKLLQEADSQGILLSSSETGGLYIWKVASAERTEGFRLDQDKNIEEFEEEEDGTQQFNSYVFIGAENHRGAPTAKAEDTTCPNKRIMTVNVPDVSISLPRLNQRALTEKNRRACKKIRCRVTGWGLNEQQLSALGKDRTGKQTLWDVNFLIPVKIPKLGVTDTTNEERPSRKLINQVEFAVEKDAVSCTLQLVERSVYA